MYQEKRLNKRITLSLPINYEALETKSKEMDTTASKDISESGIKMIFKKFYPPKTKFLIRVNLEEINKTIETIAETVWSFNMRFSDMYYNGLRFLDLNTTNQKALSEYIAIKEVLK